VEGRALDAWASFARQLQLRKGRFLCRPCPVAQPLPPLLPAPAPAPVVGRSRAAECARACLAATAAARAYRRSAPLITACEWCGESAESCTGECTGGYGDGSLYSWD
jgi:hypothetical protein